MDAVRRATPKHQMQTRREAAATDDRLDHKQLDVWRKGVTKRDGLKCRWCRRKVVETIKAQPNQSQTHHATPREHKPTRYDVRNGIRLCGTCHDRITGTVGEKAIIVASQTFTLNGREYPDMTHAVQFKVIVERQRERGDDGR
jgi:hypothetical protein